MYHLALRLLIILRRNRIEQECVICDLTRKNADRTN
ncbi:Uncharacterised protein [Yersinia kristensenii]|uniref:Uncharacterized protein n=1 Tax=Yersinia kristensenii TaxID=28152 RepID=A0A0T9L4H6_YERKR|nr:Uncharacterised protein [Yersinia kristensenii]CNE50251.1 Uncharacterised protein [Yersinia kristensenii]CNE57303.1 Uncharacterised protein [Yersinia kristensenii]CNG88884.1 Uncharacterised protein [Yersinia kristensenii]CNK92292.1 Uncharacterised protein [Yersinia kristensenii]